MVRLGRCARRAGGLALVASMIVACASWLAAPASADAESVRLQPGGSRYDTLADAVAAADLAGFGDYTLEVIGDVQEPAMVAIGDANVTLVGADGDHTVSFAASGPPLISATGSGSLTLGDGTAADLLTLTGGVVKSGGSILVRDGIAIIDAREGAAPADFPVDPPAESDDEGRAIPDSQARALPDVAPLAGSGNALYLEGDVTGAITGGYIEGYTGMRMEDQVHLTAISGGEFVGRSAAVELNGSSTEPVGQTIDLISGGIFRKTDSTLARSTVHVDNNSRIGAITGGAFSSVGNARALMVIRGSWIEEISGGTFDAPGATGRQGAVQIYGDFVPVPTGIGTISGGRFSGGPSTGGMQSIGLAVSSSNGAGGRIGAITGGVFQADTAFEPDVNSTIGAITGGTFAGAGQRQQATSFGILNVGTIDEIGGDAVITGASAGIWNYINAGHIALISGGTISVPADNIYAYFSPGILNAGTIDRIAGGTIIGNDPAIDSDTGNPGTLSVITGGVFWSRNNSTFNLAAGRSLQLEPDLTASVGVGRYQAGNGSIFPAADEALVVYPTNHIMSAVDDTLAVGGITQVQFRYLRLPVDWEFTLTVVDSFAADSGAGLYIADAAVTVDAGIRDGYTFAGWTSDDEAPFVDAAAAVTTFAMPARDVTVTATWIAVPEPPTGGGEGGGDVAEGGGDSGGAGGAGGGAPEGGAAGGVTPDGGGELIAGPDDGSLAQTGPRAVPSLTLLGLVLLGTGTITAAASRRIRR